jgi:hypothetical protein
MIRSKVPLSLWERERVRVVSAKDFYTRQSYLELALEMNIDTDNREIITK